MSMKTQIQFDIELMGSYGRDTKEDKYAINSAFPSNKKIENLCFDTPQEAGMAQLLFEVGNLSVDEFTKLYPAILRMIRAETAWSK